MSDKIDIASSTPGIKTELIFDDSEGKLHINEVCEDVEPLLNLNEIRQNDGSGGWSESRELRCAASIDLVTWLDLERRGIANDPARLKRWLNDSDNRKFRTALFRV